MSGLRSKRARAGRRGERGFALIEILVAFVVLALGLGAIATGVVVAMRSDSRTQVHRSALRIAQSRLEAAGISERLVPGTREGLVADKYRWRQMVTAIADTAGDRGPQGVQAAPVVGQLRSFWVEITVESPDGNVTKLAALKLAAKTSP